MTTSCPILTPEQRAAMKPWAIAMFATMGVSILASVAAFCYLLLVKDADFRIAGTCIITTGILSHFAKRYISARAHHITGLEPPPGAARS